MKRTCPHTPYAFTYVKPLTKSNIGRVRFRLESEQIVDRSLSSKLKSILSSIQKVIKIRTTLNSNHKLELAVTRFSLGGKTPFVYKGFA